MTHQEAVAKLFVQRYYDTLSNRPDEMFLFYRPDYPQPILYNDATTIKIKSITTQPTVDEALLVVVFGDIVQTQHEREKSFSQTFVLATQKDGYYVRNDIFSILDGPEEVDQQVLVDVEVVVVEEEEQQVPDVEPVEEVIAVQNEDIVQEISEPVPLEVLVPAIEEDVVVQEEEEEVIAAPAGEPENQRSKEGEDIVEEKDEATTKVEGYSSEPWNKKRNSDASKKSSEGKQKRNNKKSKNEGTLFVGNIPEGTSEDDLREVFAGFGEIKRIDLLRAKRIAFVNFGQKMLVKSVVESKPFNLKESTLLVDYAKQKKRQYRRKRTNNVENK